MVSPLPHPQKYKSRVKVYGFDKHILPNSINRTACFVQIAIDYRWSHWKGIKSYSFTEVNLQQKIFNE